MELFALDVRQRGGDLAVSVLVGDNLDFAVLVCVSPSPQIICTRATYTVGVGNRAVGVAKGQADCNLRRGVGLRAHLWRGRSSFAVRAFVQKSKFGDVTGKRGRSRRQRRLRLSVNPYVDRLYFVSKKFQGPAKKFERCKGARAYMLTLDLPHTRT
jgi:hypothetical protein